MQITEYSPAGRWGEAFPVGNGHIGAMIYGKTSQEQIDLSENTFFSGDADTDNIQPHAAEAYQKMKLLAEKEDFAAVREASKEFTGIRGNYGTNLPVGSFFIDTGLKGTVKDYERHLDLAEGVVCSSWKQQDCKVQTKAFASHVHSLLYYEIRADYPVFQFEIRYETQRSGEYIKYNPDSIYFECQAKETIHSDGSTGTKLAGKAAVKTDGCPQADDISGCLQIKDASFMSIIVLTETDFDLKGEDASFLQMQMRLNRRLVKCETIPEKTLFIEHTADMRSLADRVTLEITGEGEELSKIPLMFQMGRYLLYSSSREDSALPAHLQGIWNDNVACRIGWSCDMHLDINTQMNYWPAEVTNLPEVTRPLFSWIRDRLVPNGRKTAQRCYGLNGWAAELVSNAWGYAAPYWGRNLAPCPGGGAWILTHMWEHYLFTQDKKFLAEEAYPLIEEAVEFFEGYLFEDKDGHLTCGPSISPENSFIADGETYQISNGCTYEILLIRELLHIYVDAARILRRNNKKIRTAQEDLKRLLPYRITKEGQIAEWNHDYSAADPQHRHTSHLLGVFPFYQIMPGAENKVIQDEERKHDEGGKPDEERKLDDAAETSIQARLTPAENFEETGWSRSLMALYEIRLGHSEKAISHIRAILARLTKPNGFIIHPPTRGAAAFDSVYELDGNTGFTTCIAEMLLQSQGGVIRLLPCIPLSWHSGHVKGLIARGGVLVEIRWEGSDLEASLTAKKNGNYIVTAGKYKETVRLSAGKMKNIRFTGYR